jgi:hypothetical protein
MDDILLLLRLSNLLLLLWLSRLLLLWLSRVLLRWLHRLQQLWLNRLLLLARGTAGCQLLDSEMTSSAHVSGMTDVNHLQFRIRRVQDNILNNPNK